MPHRMTRRRVLDLMAAGGVLLAAGPTASAEAVGICAFSHAGHPGSPFHMATVPAVDIVDSARKVLGFGSPIKIFQSVLIVNAAAYPSGTLTDTDTIVYNPQFLNSVRRIHPMAGQAILAHQVGHFVRPTRFLFRPHERELGADYFAGCALKWDNVRSSDATLALRAMFDRFGSPSHPSTPRRLAAMEQGYRDC